MSGGVSTERAGDEEREGLCENCGAEYPVWFAPNPLWNRVMRGGVRANADMFAFICPTCFANIADAQNGSQLIWVLQEDGKSDDYLRAELDMARSDSSAFFQRATAAESCVERLEEALRGLDAPLAWIADFHPKAMVQMPGEHFAKIREARSVLLHPE